MQRTSESAFATVFDIAQRTNIFDCAFRHGNRFERGESEPEREEILQRRPEDGKSGMREGSANASCPRKSKLSLGRCMVVREVIKYFI